MKYTKKIFMVMLLALVAIVMVACGPKSSLEAPVVSPASAVFDLDNPADVTVDLDLKGETLTDIKLDDQTLASSNYQQAVGKLTIRSSYLLTLSAGSYEFVISTKGGSATLKIDVIKAASIPTISPAVVTFDKDHPENVVVDIDLKGEALTSIQFNNENLDDANYNIENGKLTVLATFLQPLSNGNYVLVVKTKDGSATLTITVKDAASPEVTPNEATFDKTQAENVVVEVDLKGETLQSVKLDEDVLTSSDYELSGNTLTILVSYLQSLPVGTHTLVISTVGGTATVTLTVVDDSDPIFVRPDYDVEFYDNLDFHDYAELSSNIEGQWPGYGIGDPFVMRYNGMFYLYVSTLDTENGVRAWKSPDLMNWEQAQGEGLPLGYVVSPEDYTSRAAYAPEVFYFNGVFYMYISPAGNGHYIYTSDHPEGPFTRQTDNLGMTIDGSVLIDDDESMYFTRANTGGIRIHQMANMLDISPSSVVLDNTNIGGWTEGSYILKRDGIYYLTYTGLHVASNGYRISYATANDGQNLYDRGAFNSGMNLPMLLETGNEHFQGLGHSATVMGPDMDSHYLVYHNLNNAGGPNRSLNIDRLLFNGHAMEVMATPTNSVKPKLPEFAAYNIENEEQFDVTDGKVLSKVATSDVFTAEFNYRGSSDMKAVVSYQDDNNYLYVEALLNNNQITLHQVMNGNDTLIATGTLVNDFKEDVLHTIRVAQKDGVVNVYFDNLLKIKDAEVSLTSGRIGYLYNGNPSFGYTAFSNVAHGLSDQLEVKQSHRRTFANLYNEELSSGVTLSTITEGAHLGANQATLPALNDQATYLVNFEEDGFYGLTMTYPASDRGKKIGVKVDGSDVMMVTLPYVETNEKYITALVTEFAVTAGINQIRIENVDETVSFVDLTFFKSSPYTPQFSHDLTDYMLRGSDYKTIWKLAGEDGHRATAGTRQLVYIGDDTITDFTMEVTIKFVGTTSTSTAGIIFRAGNDSFSQHDNYTSIQGYYLSLNNSEVRLEKLNYGAQRLQTIAGSQGANASGEDIHLKIVARGNTFEIYRNDELLITYTDANPFVHGHLGFYTNGAEVTYKNLVITK